MKDEYILKLDDVVDRRETALVGRSHGEETLKALAKMGIVLEKLEKEFQTIKVVVPGKIVSINKSFFLGMFGTSVQRLGRASFIDRYVFVATEHIVNKIVRNIDAALLTATQGEILDVAE